MTMKCLTGVLAAIAVAMMIFAPHANAADTQLDDKLKKALEDHGFPKDLDKVLEGEKGLKRKLDPKKVELGRDLFFDRVLSLSNDNTHGDCAMLGNLG